jgi:hypothetical protein
VAGAREALLVAGVLTLALAGCVPGSDPDAGPTATSAAGPPTAALPSAEEPTPALPSISIGVPADQSTSAAPRSCFDRVLDARQVHLKGRRGSVRWDLAVPQFSGASSAAAVNRHVRASAQDAIDRAVAESRHDGGAERTVGGKGQVSTSDRRTVQVELSWADYLAGTAHPSDYVATTVVTTDAGKPVLLGEVLGDERSALVTLGRAVRSLAARKGEDVTEPDGLAPRARNFANWQTTRSGMRFTFGDYQLGGHGLRSYTVPWKTVRPLLSAYGTGLLDPDIDPSTC